MTIWTPGWMQGGSYTAQFDRINSRANDFDEGVMDRLSFKATQRGAGANMSVDIAAGDAIVTGDDQANQGNYTVKSDATVNVTGFVATSANQRYDLVGIQINDPNAGGAAGSNATLVRVVGAQSATPVIPSLPASFLLLAIIGPFTNATTSITTGMIFDVWTGGGPTGVATTRLLAGRRDAPGASRETWNGVADNGWLLENGAAVSRSTYARLFEHIGTVFGIGDGSTTFNLPDSRGRVMVAADNMGGSDAGNLTSANAIGTTLGEEKHTLVQAELPNVTLSIDPPATGPIVNVVDGDAFKIVGRDNSGANTYGIPLYANAGATPLAVNILNSGVFSGNNMGDFNMAAFNSPALGSGTSHNTMQPSITCNRMIRT